MRRPIDVHLPGHTNVEVQHTTAPPACPPICRRCDRALPCPSPTCKVTLYMSRTSPVNQTSPNTALSYPQAPLASPKPTARAYLRCPFRCTGTSSSPPGRIRPRISGTHRAFAVDPPHVWSPGKSPPATGSSLQTSRPVVSIGSHSRPLSIPRRNCFQWSPAEKPPRLPLARTTR